MAARTAHQYPTLAHILKAAVERAPAHEALVLDENRLTYAQYWTAVQGLRHQLRARQTSSGSDQNRVATVLPNGLETCVASYAVWMADAQLVPLNPLYTERELKEILIDAAPQTLIYHQRLAATMAPVVESLTHHDCLQHVIVVGENNDQENVYRWLEHGATISAPLTGSGPGGDSLGLLQYTGGTTGRAKGVDLTHQAIAFNVYQRERALPTQDRHERILCAMPLFHAYGFSMGLLLAADCAGTLVIRECYHPVDLLAHFSKENISIFPGAPTIYNGLVAHENFPETDFSTLTTCYSGSAPLAVDTMNRWQAMTSAPIFEGYGQTEAGPVLAFNHIGRKQKPGTVGEAVVDTEIELVDPVTKKSLNGQGVVGEIRARGPQLMRGYRGLPEESRHALVDGWLYTGDLGEFDEDGYLIIRDRLKDMVIVGGYNVYPREIEEVLFMNPAVVDAAAIGVADDYRGEVIWAYVVLNPGVDRNALELTLADHCKKNLSRYKCPANISFVASLPKTTVNKTDKAALRALAMGH